MFHAQFFTNFESLTLFFFSFGVSAQPAARRAAKVDFGNDTAFALNAARSILATINMKRNMSQLSVKPITMQPHRGGMDGAQKITRRVEKPLSLQLFHRILNSKANMFTKHHARVYTSRRFDKNATIRGNQSICKQELQLVPVVLQGAPRIHKIV